MYLNHIEITHVSPCFADTSKIRVKANLSDDVTEMMPYLNGAVKNAVYNPHAPNLTLYREFRLVTLHPRELTLIKALNTTDARQVLAWLQDLINETAARRDEIEPVYQAKQRPHPLKLFAWLPRTNCRQDFDFNDRDIELVYRQIVESLDSTAASHKRKKGDAM